MKDKLKEKQIEEILEKVGIRYGMDVEGTSYIVNAHKLASYLQPKLPEHSVVLSGEQCVEIVQDNYNIGYERGSKETVEKYHKAMRKVIHERDYIEGYAEIGLQEENDEIAKQFGVEIKGD